MNFNSFENLTLQELKLLIQKEKIVGNFKTKIELINALKFHYVEKLILQNFSFQKTHDDTQYISYRNTRPRKTNKRYYIQTFIKSVREQKPSVSVLPGSEKIELTYNEIYDIQEIIYYSENEILIAKIKNNLYLMIKVNTIYPYHEYWSEEENNYDVFIGSNYEGIIASLTNSVYEKYIEETYEEKDTFYYENRNTEYRFNKIPSRSEFLYYVSFLEKLQMNVIYWSHLNLFTDTSNYILYKFKDIFYYIEFFISLNNNTIDYIPIKNIQYKTYKEAILSMSPKVYNLYMLETIDKRKIQIVTKKVDNKSLFLFKNLLLSLRGEAIDIRNSTKESSKFINIENVRKYHVVSLHYDNISLTEITELKDRKKSIVIFENEDGYFVAFTFYIESVCKGVEFECIQTMTDIKEYIGYNYEDLIHSFSDTDFRFYSEL